MIIPFYIEFILYLFLFVLLFFLGFGFYIYIYIPSYKLYMDLQSPPPEEGSIKEILLGQNEKRKVITIGALTSDISLRLKGIEEPHVEITVQKEKGLEEYIVTIRPFAKNKVLWKAPHVKDMNYLNEPDSFESRELIGHPAYLRVVALMQKNRPLHYVEFELSVKFIIDNFGEERMKFFLKINRIYPGVDLKSRDKKGIYSFGRIKTEEKEQSLTES